MLYSPGWDVLFDVVDDDGGKVFYGCVDVNEVNYDEVCEGVTYVVDGSRNRRCMIT